jgi:hypothetical protein
MGIRNSFAFLGIALLASSGSAAVYNFLPVAVTGPSSSQFSSQNNGVINVTDTFSPGGAGGADNVNSAIFPSQFPVLFPGTGSVQGHLAQTVYNHTSAVTFDLTGYTLSASTVFGIWNTTDEVTAPAGGPPVYQVVLIDSFSNPVAPTTFNPIGNEDNATQVTGRHHLSLNTVTGEITPGLPDDPNGTHTDAAFWDQIPVGTRDIIVYANLPPLNNIGDGVGYYFAEVAVPEPTTLSLLGLASAALLRRRRA